MKVQVIAFLLFLLVGLVVFWALNKLIVKKLSYPIEKRYLHIRLFFAGLLVTVLLCNTFSSSYLLLLVDYIINLPALTQVFDFILPSRAFELVYIVLCMIGLNLIYTIAMIITLLITKIIFRRKQNYIDFENYDGAEKILHFPWFFVRRFYHADDDKKVHLSSRGFILGMWIKGMKRAFAILFVLEFGLLYWSILWGSEEWNQTMLEIARAVFLIPMIGFLMTEQIQLLLEGNETTDLGSFSSVDIKSEMDGQVENLLYHYRDIYGESGALLYSEIGTKNNIDKKGLQSNDIGNQQLEDCDEQEILTVISNQIKESGISQNTSYQNAVISLLNGKSVSLRDNADGEFSIYLCAFLNYFLSQGKITIVLCKDKAEVELMNRALKDNIARLNVLDSVWNIRTRDKLNTEGKAGVLLCTYNEFLLLEVSDQYEYLLDDVYFAVVPNNMALMSLDCVRTELLFSKFRIFRHLKQFIFISEVENESLRTKIKLYLPEETDCVSFSNDMRKKNTSLMIWKEESSYRLQRVLGIEKTISPYMGTAIPLVLTALKYDLPIAYIVPEGNRGDVHYFESAMQSNQNSILNYLEKDMDLKSLIRYSPEEAIVPAGIKMIVVYDTEYNFFCALWRWFKYSGTQGTIIHVISPFYMLREYFTANFKRKSLLYSNNEFVALFPNTTVLMKTRLAAILARLGNVGMTENELMTLSRKYGWGYTEVTSLLKDALLTVRSVREVHNIYEHFRFSEEKYFDKEKMDFVSEIRITLSDNRMIEQQKNQIGMAKMSYKNGQSEELDVLSGNILNYYLPAQVVAFNGQFFHIDSVDMEEGIIYTTLAHSVDPMEYFLLSDFVLTDYTLLNDCVNSPIIDYNICKANAERILYGYISSKKGNDFSNNNKPTVVQTAENNENYRVVSMKDVPVLEINLRLDCLGATDAEREKNIPKVLKLLCVLLNGMFKTLFPSTYQNLIAVPGLPINQENMKSAMQQVYHDAPEKLIDVCIPRIRINDNYEINKYAKIYVIEFSCLEYGMVEKLYLERRNIMLQMYEYLNWYMASIRTESDSAGEENVQPSDGVVRGRYLHFGMEQIPDIFAPELLLDILGRITGENEEEIIEPDPVETNVRQEEKRTLCSFCNREVIFSWRLSDGRCMCAHCHDHQKTQSDEINKLFLETKKAMQSHYHIELRDDIHIHFQSADAIRRVAGGVENGRIVGFYNHGKHQLWIEAKGPAVAMESTIVHELTHAWQHDNLPLKQLAKSFSHATRNAKMLLLLEGHAVYVEIETMREKGEIEYAKRLQASYLQRNDDYGKGYRMIYDYMQSRQEEGSHVTPFVAMSKLVEEIIHKEANIVWPEGS